MSDDLLVVILAAGLSSRLGRAKQLLLNDDETLIHRQCRMAMEAAIAPVAVVLGCEAEACAASVADLDVRLIWNSQWEEGLASSIRCAVREAMLRNAVGLLLWHVDQ